MHIHAKPETRAVQTKPHLAEPIPVPLAVRPSHSNSAVISTATLKKHGCFTTLQARRAKHMSFCHEALSMSMKDWTTHIGDHRAYIFPATRNEVSGNWVALVMPEAIPFRLGLMTYAAHLIFLHEDIEQASITGEADTKLDSKIVDGLAAALPTVPGAETNQTASLSLDRLLNPLIKALMSTDRHTATEIVAVWRKHFATPDSTAAETVTSFNTYIESRVHTASTEAWLAMLRYSLGLHLSASSLEVVPHITVAAMKSVTLTTDYWSWTKQSRSPSNNVRAMNAVPFAMAELGIGETEAREHVKKMALEAEMEFSKLKKAFGGAANGKEDTEIATYLDAVEAFAAGHSLWCSTCPRYHGLV